MYLLARKDYFATDKYSIRTKAVGTKVPGQTVETLIRLLLRSSLIRDSTVCHSISNFCHIVG